MSARSPVADTLRPGATVHMWRRRALHAGTSMMDQGTLAGAALLLNLGLARVLEPEAYGSFAVGLSILIFVLGIHTVLIAEPMSIIGPVRHQQGMPGYLRVILRVHGAVSLGFAGLLALTAAVMAMISPPTARTFAAMSVAVLPYLLLALARRVGYLQNRPVTALMASGLYALALAAGGAVLLAADSLTAPSAYLLIGVASLIGCFPFLWRMSRASDDTAVAPAWRSVLRENWTYGRWMFLAAMAHWLSVGSIVPVLGALASLEAAGVYRALSNLLAPVQQLMTAATMLVLPRLAAGREQGGGDRAGWRELMLGALTGPLTAIYVVVLIIWGRDLLDLLYDQPAYSAHAALIGGFAVYAILLAFSHSLAVALRAREDTASIFNAKLASAAAALLLGFPLIWSMGLTGAVVALNISTLAEAAVLAFRFPWQRSSDG